MAITLVVEDGTGVSGANTYVTAAVADTYHTDANNTDWTGTADEKASKLIRAFRVLNSRYRGRLQGVKSSSDNESPFPRYGMSDEDGYSIDSDTIPQGVKDAQMELARILPVSHSVTAGATVKAVGAGSARVEFTEAGVKGRKVLDAVCDLMRIYTRPSRVVRA